MALNRITHGRASLEARRRLAIDVEAVGDDLDGDGTEAVAAKPRSKGGRFTRILASSWVDPDHLVCAACSDSADS